jgi:hypothetical protein
MQIEFRFIPEGKSAYSAIQAIPGGSGASGDRPYFRDGDEVLKFIETLAPGAEGRADWETYIANRSGFAVFVQV